MASSSSTPPVPPTPPVKTYTERLHQELESLDDVVNRLYHYGNQNLTSSGPQRANATYKYEYEKIFKESPLGKSLKDFEAMLKEEFKDYPEAKTAKIAQDLHAKVLRKTLEIMDNKQSVVPQEQKETWRKNWAQEVAGSFKAAQDGVKAISDSISETLKKDLEQISHTLETQTASIADKTQQIENKKAPPIGEETDEQKTKREWEKDQLEKNLPKDLEKQKELTDAKAAKQAQLDKLPDINKKISEKLTTIQEKDHVTELERVKTAIKDRTLASQYAIAMWNKVNEERERSWRWGKNPIRLWAREGEQGTDKMTLGENFDLNKPGSYSSPDSKFVFHLDDKGNVKIQPLTWWNFKEGIEEAMDFLRVSKGVKSITLTYDKPADVDFDDIKHAMKLCTEKGLSINFDQHTEAALRGKSKSFREGILAMQIAVNNAARTKGGEGPGGVAPEKPKDEWVEKKSAFSAEISDFENSVKLKTTADIDNFGKIVTSKMETETKDLPPEKINQAKVELYEKELASVDERITKVQKTQTQISEQLAKINSEFDKEPDLQSPALEEQVQVVDQLKKAMDLERVDLVARVDQLDKVRQEQKLDFGQEQKHFKDGKLTAQQTLAELGDKTNKLQGQLDEQQSRLEERSKNKLKNT